MALFVAVLALATLPGAVLAWDAGAFSAADESLMASLTNQRRAASGLPALTVDGTLHSVARWRSKDMADRNYFGHSIPPNGTTVYDELTARGYCYTLAAENIGWGTWPDETATQTMQATFESSSAHLQTILGDYTAFGVGAYKGSDGKKIWTVIFAHPCSATLTPSPKATALPTPGAPTPAATARPSARPSPGATSSSSPVAAATTQPPASAAPAETPGFEAPAEPLGSASPTAEVLGIHDPPDDTAAGWPGASPFLLSQWLLDLVRTIIRSLIALLVVR